MVDDWDAFTRTLSLPTPEQFDEVSHASGLPTRAEDLGPGYDDGLLFWALRNSHLLRERISIVDLADAARGLVGRGGAVDHHRRREGMKEDSWLISCSC